MLSSAYNEQLSSAVYSHFGLAPLLLVFDTETQQVLQIDNLKFRDLRGTERFRSFLAEQQVDAMAVTEIGAGAYRNLLAAGIKVLQATTGPIAENLDALARNNFKEIEKENINMNGQGKGLGQGRGMNCRRTSTGRAMGRNQGAGCGQGLGAGRGPGQGLGDRQHLAATPVADQGLGGSQEQGLGRGRGQGLGFGG